MGYMHVKSLTRLSLVKLVDPVQHVLENVGWKHQVTVRSAERTCYCNNPVESELDIYQNLKANVRQLLNAGRVSIEERPNSLFYATYSEKQGVKLAK